MEFDNTCYRYALLLIFVVLLQMDFPRGAGLQGKVEGCVLKAPNYLTVEQRPNCTSRVILKVLLSGICVVKIPKAEGHVQIKTLTRETSCLLQIPYQVVLVLCLYGTCVGPMMENP